MVSLTGSEASDVGDMEEIPGALPESAPTPTKGPKRACRSGLTRANERITSETIVSDRHASNRQKCRIFAAAEGEVVFLWRSLKTGDGLKAWNRLYLNFLMKRFEDLKSRRR